MEGIKFWRIDLYKWYFAIDWKSVWPFVSRSKLNPDSSTSAEVRFPSWTKVVWFSGLALVHKKNLMSSVWSPIISSSSASEDDSTQGWGSKKAKMIQNEVRWIDFIFLILSALCNKKLDSPKCSEVHYQVRSLQLLKMTIWVWHLFVLSISLSKHKIME